MCRKQKDRGLEVARVVIHWVLDATPTTATSPRTQMATIQPNRHSISLKGSTQIVVEFFGKPRDLLRTISFHIGSRRERRPASLNIYVDERLNLLVPSHPVRPTHPPTHPPTSHDDRRRPGVVSEADLRAARRYTGFYIEFFPIRIERNQLWLANGKISKLVLAIKSKETTEVLERWQFDIQVIDGAGNKEKADRTAQKTEKEINAEIQAIIRQITASVTFLPMLEEKCTFNILVYADKDAEVPTTWCDSDPHLLKGGSEHVKLRSFSTNFHKVDALVAYRRNDDV
ncbi:hypothetical protein BC936DRAFT_138029 [Jimgerdemannia flammicorona]|uniref:HORMA domain-containing protein n=1 Tax=Jimgerdemannia flammicorona TaxID=994334 RepID=A0A433CVY3_9FUNG|nr:hypothetical protein BC936DRAFT_138029 [Jimgerdemannia flammicorona]